jgi:hypothetical protein
MTNALIVRAMMAADWYAAYQVVWAATYAGVPSTMAKPVNRSDWGLARLACLLRAEEARKAGDADGEGAWSLLGADPRGMQSRSLAGGRTYVPALREIGRAIVDDPTLLDDLAFCQAVEGWRFLEVAGASGDDDLIEAAHSYGSMGKIEREQILGRALMWSADA